MIRLLLISSLMITCTAWEAKEPSGEGFDSFVKKAEDWNNLPGAPASKIGEFFQSRRAPLERERQPPRPKFNEVFHSDSSIIGDEREDIVYDDQDYHLDDFIPGQDRDVTYTVSFQVEPREEECFYNDLPAGETVSVYLFVLRGGLLDIMLDIRAPDDSKIFSNMIFSNRDDSGRIVDDLIAKGHTFITEEAGTYKVCFNNKVSRWTSKVIIFDFVVGYDKELLDGEDIDVIGPEISDSLEQVKRMERSLQNILNKMRALEVEQSYYKRRISRHHKTTESTKSRVVFYTFIETGVAIGFGLFQYFYVRHWFKDAFGGSRV